MNKSRNIFFLWYNVCKFITVVNTINRRLSTLQQGGGPVHAPFLVFVSMVMVSAMAAVPGTAQRDVDPDVESPVAWGHITPQLEDCNVPVYVSVCMLVITIMISLIMIKHCFFVTPSSFIVFIMGFLHPECFLLWWSALLKYVIKCLLLLYNVPCHIKQQVNTTYYGCTMKYYQKKPSLIVYIMINHLVPNYV